MRIRGHTREAPIALRTSATFIMLKSAKNSRAYGKKHRRTINSVWRPKYKNGFDDRLFAWVCQIFSSCSGRSAARRCRCPSCRQETCDCRRTAADSRIPEASQTRASPQAEGHADKQRRASGNWRLYRDLKFWGAPLKWHTFSWAQPLLCCLTRTPHCVRSLFRAPQLVP